MSQSRPILFSGPMVRAILERRKTMTRRVLTVHRQVLSSLDHGLLEFKRMETDPKGGAQWAVFDYDGQSDLLWLKCKYGQPGDSLYVKEAAWMWCERRPNGRTPTGRAKWLYVPLESAPVRYVADHPEKPRIDVVSPRTGNAWGWRLKVARFLPRWASRITLDVTAVRVERLQEITHADAVAEGVIPLAIAALDRSHPLHDKMFSRGHDVYDDETGEPHPDGPFAGLRETFAALWDSLNADRGFGWDVNPWVFVIEFAAPRTGAGA